MDIKKVVYGRLYYTYRIYDIALSVFNNSDFIRYESIYKNTFPDNMQSVYHFLETEGMIKIGEYGLSITEKGKNMIMTGGFVRQLLIKRITFASIIIGVISAFAAIFESLMNA